ncbi:MAG: hypothetical protein WAZ60_23820 [Desulfosalsimonadaceae bacterium]
MNRDSMSMHIKVGSQWVPLETWKANQKRRKATIYEAVGALIFLGLLSLSTFLALVVLG